MGGVATLIDSYCDDQDVHKMTSVSSSVEFFPQNLCLALRFHIITIFTSTINSDFFCWFTFDPGSGVRVVGPDVL